MDILLIAYTRVSHQNKFWFMSKLNALRIHFLYSYTKSYHVEDSSWCITSFYIKWAKHLGRQKKNVYLEVCYCLNIVPKRSYKTIKKNHILENRAKKSTSYEAVEIIEIFFCDADLIQT